MTNFNVKIGNCQEPNCKTGPKGTLKIICYQVKGKGVGRNISRGGGQPKK